MYNKGCNVTMMFGLFGELNVWMGVLFDDVVAYSSSSSSSSSSSALLEKTAKKHTKQHRTRQNLKCITSISGRAPGLRGSKRARGDTRHK